MCSNLIREILIFGLCLWTWYNRFYCLSYRASSTLVKEWHQEEYMGNETADERTRIGCFKGPKPKLASQNCQCRTSPSDICQMWYDILPSYVIIVLAMGAPHGLSYVFNWLVVGNCYRREVVNVDQRLQYLRDKRLSGNPYKLRGLEALPDELCPEECPEGYESDEKPEENKENTDEQSNVQDK